MTIWRKLGLILAAGALLAGCTDGGVPAPGSTASPAKPSPTKSASPKPTTSTTSKIVFDWGYPTEAGPVKINSIGTFEPLPELIEIVTAKLSGRDRIVFRFNHGLPASLIHYGPPPTSGGTGEPLPLPDANAYLYIEFDAATSHDDSGKSTIQRKDSFEPGYSVLKSWWYEDFEGLRAYLGLSTAPNSDQLRQVRLSVQEDTTGTDKTYALIVEVR